MLNSSLSQQVFTLQAQQELRSFGSLSPADTSSAYKPVEAKPFTPSRVTSNTTGIANRSFIESSNTCFYIQAKLAYRQDQRMVREQYEERFADRGTREVRIQRVVNVERRTTVSRTELEYDRAYDDDQQYGGSRSQQDQRGYRGESIYPSIDREYSDENMNLGSFQRNSSPPRREDSYSYYSSNRDDGQVRRQVEIRSSGRAGPYLSSRGQGIAPPLMSISPAISDRADKMMQAPGYIGRGEDHDDYRWREPYTALRDRSPIRREAQPPILSRPGSNSSSRSYSPDRDRGYSYQQIQQKRHDETHGQNRELDKPRSLTGHTPRGSKEGSPHSSVSLKEEPPASVTESEEVLAASKEPKLTPEEDFKARRSQAIATKALEIEKLYRQDCETFGTVVKMLVAKEPSLDQLLQAPLNENLEEIKQRCLDDLKHFIKELDQVVLPPETST